MARKLCGKYACAIYHVTNRGDRWEKIFLMDRDLFLETLTKVCARAGWLLFACYLMPNLFHLVIETA